MRIPILFCIFAFRKYNLKSLTQMAHVIELRTAPLPTVRIGLIGLGLRGMKTLQRYRYIPHAEIRAVADIDPNKLAAANEALRQTGRAQAVAFSGKEAWKEICRRADIDLIYICTDWNTHAAMAMEAMENGKHAAVEVPAAMTVEECKRLVETSEHTRKHCFMTENCCYDFASLALQNMHKQGLFGEINHCEGAYIHYTRDAQGNFAPWMKLYYARHGGNPYPTHGLGPIGWLLNLHRGDRMDHLVSMTTAHGHINNTLIQTHKGTTILLQLDVTSNRPYSRLQTICGSKGFAQKYPLPMLRHSDHTFEGEAAEKEWKKYLPESHAGRLWRKAQELHVPNEMNYTMDRRLIHCLHHGLPLDIDVYDAAEWSCIAELSRISAQEGSRPVPVPDFTHGHWKERTPHRFFFYKNGKEYAE